MIVLFDCNSYDKLIKLSRNDLQKIKDRVEKIIMPQVVREQLNMMIERPDKIEKLSKINQIIAEFDIAGKIAHIANLDANQTYFDSLPKKMRNGDKEIALIAKEEGAVMITDDESFLEGLKLINQRVCGFEGFLRFLV